MAFIISDFHDLDAAGEHDVLHASAHSDITLIHVFDPLEQELPPPGDYPIVSPDGRTGVLATSSDAMRRRHRQRFIERTARITGLARACHGRYLRCETTDDPMAVLRFGQRPSAHAGPRQS